MNKTTIPLMTTIESEKMQNMETQFEAKGLYHAVYAYVKSYMSRYDASHDFNHILRVLALAKHILASEVSSHTKPTYDYKAIVLAALLHDVGDKKYLEPGENATTAIRDILGQNSCPVDLQDKVAEIVEHVSYTSEIKRPAVVAEVLVRIPELGIVQDADRLDAIGAVGVGRAFAFGAVKVPERGLQGSVDHFEVKLERIEGMMKTATGKRIARERTVRLKAFRGWWEEECELVS